MRLRLYQIVYRAQPGDTISRCYDIFIVAISFISILPFMFKSSQTSPEVKFLFEIIDALTVYVLVSDYVLRWITYDIHKGIGWKAFFIYPFNPLVLIDLLSILPSITRLDDGLKFLRVLRIVRVLRMSKGLVILTNVFKKEFRPLISVVFFIFVYIFSIALIMFNVEPNIFKDFTQALYWSATSLATIGYGDIAPQSAIGQGIMIVSAILGIAVIAFPAGIITGGYLEQIRNADERGESYFTEETTSARSFRCYRPQDYGGIVDYFKSNRKVVVYAIFIILGVAVNLLTEMINVATDPIILFEEFGTLMLAILIEPTVGFVVGLISDILYCIITQNPSHIMFYIITMLYILVFSYFCRRGKKLTIKNIVIVMLLCLIIGSFFSTMISFYSDVAVNYYDQFYKWIYKLSDTYNINLYVVGVMAIIVLNCTNIVVDLIGVFFVRRFIYGSKFDPIYLIDKEERHSFEVYSDLTDKKEYIEDWSSDFGSIGNDWKNIAAEGISSIDESLDEVRASRVKIKEMEDKISKFEEEINKQRELIAEERQEIDVKKKALKQIVRKGKKKNPD